MEWHCNTQLISKSFILLQLKFGSWVNEHYKVQYRLASTSPDQGNRSNSIVTEDISLREFDSPIGWKVIGARAYLESTQHLPPLLEEPSQNVVFSIVFRREFVFDAFMGATQRSPSTFEQVGHCNVLIVLQNYFHLGIRLKSTWVHI